MHSHVDPVLRSSLQELLSRARAIKQAGVTKISRNVRTLTGEPETHRVYAEEDCQIWRSSFTIAVDAALPKEHPLRKQFDTIRSYADPVYLIDRGIPFLIALEEGISLGLLPQSEVSEALMRRILTDVYSRESGTPLLNYEMPGVEKPVLMRAIRKLVDLGWLDAADNSTRGGLDYAPRCVMADGLVWLEGPKSQGPNPQVVNNHYHGPVAQGHQATIATATNSPGATVTAASGSASIHQRIRVHIEKAAKHDPGVAAAIQKVADAIAASTKLAEDQRQAEAQELILAIAEECSKPTTERQPAARSKWLAAGMRDVLSLAADVLQVWTVCWPTIAPALGIFVDVGKGVI